MKETVVELIVRLILANLAAILVFIGIYKLGVIQGMAIVQNYYIVPLVILSGILIYENYKQLKIFKFENC